MDIKYYPNEKVKLIRCPDSVAFDEMLEEQNPHLALKYIGIDHPFYNPESYEGLNGRVFKCETGDVDDEIWVTVEVNHPTFGVVKIIVLQWPDGVTTFEMKKGWE